MDRNEKKKKQYDTSGKKESVSNTTSMSYCENGRFMDDMKQHRSG